MADLSATVEDQSISISLLSIQQLSEFLAGKNVSSTVIEAFARNKINGDLFLEMRESDVNEMAPLLADRLMLRRLIEEFKKKKMPRKVSPRPVAIFDL